MNGPCAKQVVRATLVARNGERFVGANDCANPQPSCPRDGLPSGVGYHLCTGICRQTGHAEVNAICAAGNKAEGSVIYLTGHTYACDDCKNFAEWAGVAEIKIEPPPVAN